MRRLAVVGLVASLVLGAIAVLMTSDRVHERRGTQDLALQAAVSGEVSHLSSGERQARTALSLMSVNPAVRELLGGRPLSASNRARDLANAALTLAQLRQLTQTPLSAACLDDAAGRQLVCDSPARSSANRAPLGREFLALARSSTVAAATGPFLSPLSGQWSVALLVPFRVARRLLGFVHLDMNVADALGSAVLVNDAPGVAVHLATDRGGSLSSHGPANPVGRIGAPVTISIGSLTAGAPARLLIVGGHRTMVDALPLALGRQQTVAVVASAIAPNPNLLNAWSPGMLALLALALATLLGSVASLTSASRRVDRELSTDPLTGVRNRRALMEELPRVCHRASEEQPAFLWFFDLNGFKHYNDSFGHVAGDALLARLGRRLRTAVKPFASVYRLGGDEFCVLIAGTVSDPHGLFLRARDALCEHGGAFAITASAGAVEIPRETRDPTHALRLADKRMYGEKANRHTDTPQALTSVLQVVLTERHPDLGEHSSDVARDVELLAHAIGLGEHDTSLIMRAADLHDVGKLGIPDGIITKAGPLSASEWEFMKQHTVIGEKIVAAAGPSMESIGPLVRASHERWDGSGYPDGLSGEEIPIGARIITICDSFSAMVGRRAYKRAMSRPEALAELRRCAGTQFDPRLVDVFCGLVEERATREHLGSVSGA